MSFVREISITRLFGLYDHHLELRRNPPLTIVAGPNGIGKTTLLGLTHSFLAGNLRELFKHDFETLSVSFDSGDVLTAEPQPHDAEDETTPLALRIVRERRRSPPVEEILEIPRRHEFALPSYIEQVGPDIYMDQRTREHVTFDELDRRYSRLRGRRQPFAGFPEWFRPDDWQTDFIETKRLDSLLGRSKGATAARRDTPRAPIHHYLDAVKEAMEESWFESSRSAQRRDRTFARRLLDKGSRLAVKPEGAPHPLFSY